MAIAFNCPHCGHAFEVADSYAGQSGPCAACNQTITVPGTLSAFPGSAAQDRVPRKGSSAPLIIGLVVGGFFALLFCGGVLAALLLPAIQAAREAARRNQCINNSKNIGLAFHNHHDVHARMPLASSRPVSGIPGNDRELNGAGYGWSVALLPFLEEYQLHDEISNQSQRFQVLPFYTEIAPLSCAKLSILTCPSSTTPQRVDIYASDYEEYPFNGVTAPPAISNYVATPSSHLTNTRGPAELFSGESFGGVNGNGMIVFPTDGGQGLNKGLGLRAVTDGTSKTVMFCETTEPAYAAWIDGQATWVVAAWPENVEIPTETGASDGMLGFPVTDVSSMTSLAASQMARRDNSMIYMEKSRLGTTYDRKFGPSSDHAGGVVVHTFGDGHVSAITADIDRTLYLRMISRNGGEPVSFDDAW